MSVSREEELARLRAALDAERAATAHWRSLAERDRTELDRIRHRFSVRVVLALERRLDPLSRAVKAAADQLLAAIEGISMALQALGKAPSRSVRRGKLAALTAPAPTKPLGSLSVVVYGDAEPSHDLRLPPEIPVTTVVQSPSEARTREISAAISTSSSALVCLVSSVCEPLDDAWLDRLASAIGDNVVASAPVLVHPDRPFTRATPFDLLVRSVGLDVDRIDGAPVARFRCAGTPLDHGSGQEDVAAVSASCVVIRRDAFDAVGGLEPVSDIDAALVALCARLVTAGQAVAVCRDVHVVDHQPVRGRRSLKHPVDPRSAGWRAVVDSHGPALVRLAGDREPRPRFAITVAAPSAKVAPRWGDWHVGEALARSLRQLGHPAAVRTLDQADTQATRSCDVHVVVRGMHRVRRTAGQIHALWIISHPERVEDRELDEANVVLVASRRFAEAVRERTHTPVEVLLQATDQHRFHPMPAATEHRHPVAIVAKTRGVMRPIMADALSVGLRPAIYGSGWDGFVDPDLVVADYIPNESLPVVYSSVQVLLNDHWDTMKASGFVSNRIFDALACGASVVSDHLPEISELFQDAVRTYETPEDLRRIVDEILTHPEQARARAAIGRDIVFGAHTFDHRAMQLVDALRRFESARFT